MALSFVLLAGLLSACNKPKIADKDGAAKRYTMTEITKEGYEGIFTMNEDDTFSPLPGDIPGYEGSTDETSPERFLWYTDNGVSFTELIPKVNNETPLVIIYNDDSSMPKKDSWYLERYEPLGPTIGAHVWLDEDKTMYLSEKDMLEGTSAYEVLSSSETQSRDEDHELQEISGSDVKLPIKNVERNTDILRGLTYGKKYAFKYLQGTRTKRVDIVADTYAFQSAEVIEMNAPYNQTENGYFILNLPLGIAKGFYYISDMGFFYFTGED